MGQLGCYKWASGVHLMALQKIQEGQIFFKGGPLPVLDYRFGSEMGVYWDVHGIYWDVHGT